MNHKDAETQRRGPVRNRPFLLCALVPLWFAVTAGAAETRTLLFFGDSLTAGYGLEDPSA